MDPGYTERKREEKACQYQGETINNITDTTGNRGGIVPYLECTQEFLEQHMNLRSAPVPIRISILPHSSSTSSGFLYP